MEAQGKEPWPMLAVSYPIPVEYLAYLRTYNLM